MSKKSSKKGIEASLGYSKHKISSSEYKCQTKWLRETVSQQVRMIIKKCGKRVNDWLLTHLMPLVSFFTVFFFLENIERLQWNDMD